MEEKNFCVLLPKKCNHGISCWGYLYDEPLQGVMILDMLYCRECFTVEASYRERLNLYQIGFRCGFGKAKALETKK